MAVHDVSKLPEPQQPFVIPSPYLSTPPVDGSRYLDALKRSVKPKPKPRPETENRQKTEPRTRPEPTRERPKPEVERPERARPETNTGETKLREQQQSTGTETDRVNNRDASTRIASSDSHVENQTQEANASQPAGESTTQVIGDIVSPPPAGFVELFADISVDASTGDAAPTQSTDEPVAPAGLATLVSCCGTVAGPDSHGSHPGSSSIQTTLTTADASSDLETETINTVNTANEQTTIGQPSPNDAVNQTSSSETQQTALESTPIELIEDRQAEGSQTQQDDNGVVDVFAESESVGAASTATPIESGASTRTAENPNRSGQPAAIHPTSTGPSSGTATTANTADASANATPPITAGDVSAKEAKPATANGATEAAGSDRGQFAQRVVNAVRGAVQGNRTFKAVLHPPELGVLQVEITGDKNGNLVARLEVNTPAAQQALQDNLNDLRAALTRQGITLDRIEIQLNESNANDEPGSQGREESRQQQREQRERQRDSKDDEHAEAEA